MFGVGVGGSYSIGDHLPGHRADLDALRGHRPGVLAGRPS